MFVVKNNNCKALPQFQSITRKETKHRKEKLPKTDKTRGAQNK